MFSLPKKAEQHVIPTNRFTTYLLSEARQILIAVLMAFSLINFAQAQTETVLYSFTGGNDGAGPAAGVISDSAGNLYGTTYLGGTSNQGTVFKFTKTGGETVLYSFTGGADGSSPRAGLLRDSAGNLYGTTAYGGNLSCQSGKGCGVVFKVTPAGQETVLYRFTGTGGDGYTPGGRLITDASGNLFGTTIYGGSSNFGIVFKLDKSGKETILHSFTNTGGDGIHPYSGLVRDSSGNLYGTTISGGSGDTGIVFKLDAGGNETILYSFGPVSSGDGATPESDMIRDSQGNFYGAAGNGGLSSCLGGCGVLYKIDSTGHESILYAFTGAGDGYFPESVLVRDGAGNLYGTSTYGGDCFLCGTIFRLSAAGKETVLHNFAGKPDGGYPDNSGLVPVSGSGYGTTFEGGTFNAGTIYRISP
jgi:uncharacterized repeat protein (TIGR03803 family)